MSVMKKSVNSPNFLIKKSSSLIIFDAYSNMVDKKKNNYIKLK
jgi:hypothetical protein